MTSFTQSELESMRDSLYNAIYQVESEYNSVFENGPEAKKQLDDLNNIQALITSLILEKRIEKL